MPIATLEKTATTLDSIIMDVWTKGDIVIGKKQANCTVFNLPFAKERILEEGIVCTDLGDGTVRFSRCNTAPSAVTERHYIMPEFADSVRSIVKRSLDGEGMANLCLTGNAGTGKTEFVYELAKEYGIKVYQVNGNEGLTNADFYGSMAVSVDEKTKQNYTYFDKGPLYRAFIEGTKLDENGNQVLDENGDPIVTGKPAFFFLDEFAAMLPEVFLGVFNRAMEIPRKKGKGRSIEITMDGGRIVKSHPSMVMFLAGNTVGTGNNGRYQMGYTAQSNKMDESTRNRITGFYKFGYNKKAETELATAMLNDDVEVKKLMRFRDSLREMFKNEKVETLVTTRTIVAVCELARTFRKSGNDKWMTDAIYTAVFNGLPESDRDAFNEVVRMTYGENFISIEAKNSDYDYM